MSKKLKKQLTKIVKESGSVNKEYINEDIDLHLIDMHLDSKVETVYNDIFKPIFDKEKQGE